MSKISSQPVARNDAVVLFLRKEDQRCGVAGLNLSAVAARIIVAIALFGLTGCAGLAQKGALDRAYKQMHKGRYDRALRKLSDAQHYATPSPLMAAEISFLRGQCYERSGRPCEAIGAYSYTFNHFPDTAYSLQAQERLKVLKLSPRIEILEYGLCKRSKGEGFGKAESDHFVNFGSQTNRVPAVLGMGFRTLWVASGLPENRDVTIRAVFVHPVMLTPDGSTDHETRYDTIIHASSEGMIKAESIYVFDHPHELVTGDWTLEIWYDDQKLTEKTFTVFDAKQSFSAKKS